MKVLHVIATMAPTSGGPTMVLRDLLSFQSDLGMEVSLCTTDRGNPVHRVLTRSEITNQISPKTQCHVFPVDMGPLLVSFAMASWLRHRIGDFDLVHIHGLYRFPSTYAATLARRRVLPYVIRPHGSLDPYLYRQSSRSRMLKRVYERLFDLPNLHGASAIHYTSEEERERASFLGLRAPGMIVPNGLDWRRFEKLPAPGRFRKRLPIGTADPLLLFLGRINFKKGLDLLIPAMARVVEVVPEAKLAIVGPDNEGYGAKVRAWIDAHGLTERVFMLGMLNGAETQQAYVDADLFVLPSYTENFGMTVIESLACGTPVVVSDQVNIWREVVDAGGGWVTQCNVSSLADTLLQALSARDQWPKMGARARPSIRDHFRWERVVEQMRAEYEKLLEKHGL